MSVDWLTGEEIENYIAKNGNASTKAAFLGTFAANTLPRQNFQLPALLIVNSDTANLPGRHWRAVYITIEHYGEIFDSLAAPINILLEKWINSVTVRWQITTKYIQHPLSPSCGAFVLHFILNRLTAKSLDNYMQQFSSALQENERKVRHFVQKLKSQ